jgi:hypothetical protein
MLSLLLALTLAAPRVEPSVEKLAWVAGHWTTERNGRTIEEHWMKPSGGTMIGMGRTSTGDKTVEFEFLRIVREGDDIFYVAQPNGSPPSKFKLVKATENEVVFENPEHDFPQRILYRRTGEALFARVEADVKGKIRGVDFPYKRADCPADGKQKEGSR